MPCILSRYEFFWTGHHNEFLTKIKYSLALILSFLVHIETISKMKFGLKIESDENHNLKYTKKLWLQTLYDVNVCSQNGNKILKTDLFNSVSKIAFSCSSFSKVTTFKMVSVKFAYSMFFIFTVSSLQFHLRLSKELFV